MARLAEPSWVYVLELEQASQADLAKLLNANGYRVVSHSIATNFLDDLDDSRSACAIIEHHLPEQDVHAIHAELLARDLCLPTIAVSSKATIADASRALRAGVIDFLEKPFVAETLLMRVAEALERQQLWRERAVCSKDVRERIAKLSKREQTIMRMVVDGQATKNIARRLDISHKTVEVHRSNITKRMGVESVPQLVRMVTEYDLVSHPR